MIFNSIKLNLGNLIGNAIKTKEQKKEANTTEYGFRPHIVYENSNNDNFNKNFVAPN